MFAVNHLNGFGVGAQGEWANVAGPITMTTPNGLWNGYAIRQAIASANLAASGGSLVRVTFDQNGGAAMSISECWIGRRAASGDAYDFAETPTRITFDGGSNGFSGLTSTKVSDAIAYSIDGTRDLIVSFSITANQHLAYKATQTGWKPYYLLGGDPAQVDATGWTDFSATQAAIFLKTVERFG